MESSPIRDRTHIPCMGRWILSHWTTREALGPTRYPHSLLPQSWKNTDVSAAKLIRNFLTNSFVKQSLKSHKSDETDLMHILWPNESWVLNSCVFACWGHWLLCRMNDSWAYQSMKPLIPSQANPEPGPSQWDTSQAAFKWKRGHFWFEFEETTNAFTSAISGWSWKALGLRAKLWES